MCCMKTLVIDSHGKNISFDDSASDTHISKIVFISSQATDAAEKVPRIIICVKTDKICSEHTIKYFIPPGKKSKQFIGRKRYVQKKTNTATWKRFAYHTRQQEQLIIVNPNRISVTDLFSDLLKEFFVDTQISIPVF